MTDGGPNCACLSVSYNPEHGDRLIKDRWTCDLCGSEFMRTKYHEYLLSAQTSQEPEDFNLWCATHQIPKTYDKCTYPDCHCTSVDSRLGEDMADEYLEAETEHMKGRESTLDEQRQADKVRYEYEQGLDAPEHDLDEQGLDPK